MIRLVFIFFLTLNLSGFSQTQAENNIDACTKFKESDKRLNEVYKAILTIYSNDTIFIQNLKKSQRIWIQFRDAEMLVKYPDYSDQTIDSIQPSCHSNYKRELTDQRIDRLIDWVIGIEEGYNCNGSIQFFEDFISDDMELAHVEKDSSITLSVNMRKVHRIFGYNESDINSTKKILISIFTFDVEHNPFNCQYGAYYEIAGMTDLSLRYLRTDGDFLEVAIIKNQKEIDKVYMLKKWFKFEVND